MRQDALPRTLLGCRTSCAEGDLRYLLFLGPLCLGEDFARFQIDKMHNFTCEAGDGNVAFTISEFIFGCVALNTKAGVGAVIEDCNHPLA
jgi:hypothetical protein